MKMNKIRIIFILFIYVNIIDFVIGNFIHKNFEQQKLLQKVRLKCCYPLIEHIAPVFQRPPINFPLISQIYNLINIF